MTINNYLNLKPNEYKKHVYRLLPIKRLKDAIIKNELYLTLPSEWDDPFENFIFQNKGTFDGKTFFSFDLQFDF